MKKNTCKNADGAVVDKFDTGKMLQQSAAQANLKIVNEPLTIVHTLSENLQPKHV